jgi:SAM-dependent methyltransferase
MKRNRLHAAIDFVTFPVRAFVLFEKDAFGLSALSSERYDYVAHEISGRCLDVGCGRYNRFINEYLGGNGMGIDVFPYEGLTEENILKDVRHFPFEDAAFDAVTFIANINHIPREDRDAELAEAFRCLKPKGRIVVTMGNALAEILVHKLVLFYEKFLGADFEMDTERGMDAEEEYYLTDAEIRSRLTRAGFRGLAKKYFLTQWGLNHMLVGWKP